MSKGQNQLLQAAMRNRRRAQEERAQREAMDTQLKFIDDSTSTKTEDTEPTPARVEDDAPLAGPIAGPITTKADQHPSLSHKDDHTKTVQRKNETMDSADNASMAGPLTSAPKNHFQIPTKFKGNLMNHPNIASVFQEYFGKVQVGEDRIIVSVAKREIADFNTEQQLDFIKRIIDKQPDFLGEVHRGSREGRFRIIAK